MTGPRRWACGVTWAGRRSFGHRDLDCPGRGVMLPPLAGVIRSHRRPAGLREAEMRGQKMKITEGRVRLAASDVANFLACRRLTQLDLLRARGELRPPREFDVGFRDLLRRGEVHERAVLERFRADGLDVVDVSGTQDGAGATREAIQAGAGVIYQGRGGTPPVHADLGVRPGRREARVRGADRLHHRAPGPLPRVARVPLQPLRADVGGPSHRTPRHPAGGGGRADGTFCHP